MYYCCNFIFSGLGVCVSVVYANSDHNVAAVMSNYDMILELQLYETKSDKLIKTKKIESVLETLLMDVPD